MLQTAAPRTRKSPSPFPAGLLTASQALHPRQGHETLNLAARTLQGALATHLRSPPLHQQPAITTQKNTAERMIPGLLHSSRKISIRGLDPFPDARPPPASRLPPPAVPSKIQNPSSPPMKPRRNLFLGSLLGLGLSLPCRRPLKPQPFIGTAPPATGTIDQMVHRPRRDNRSRRRPSRHGQRHFEFQYYGRKCYHFDALSQRQPGAFLDSRHHEFQRRLARPPCWAACRALRPTTTCSSPPSR